MLDDGASMMLASTSAQACAAEGRRRQVRDLLECGRVGLLKFEQGASEQSSNGRRRIRTI